MNGRTTVVALAAGAAALAFSTPAHAAVKKVYEGMPTKDQHKFLAKPYEADAIDFFPHTVTIHVGDSIKFLPTAFHNVDIPKRGGKPLGLLVTGPAITSVDAAGAPYWFSGALPTVKFNPAIVPPSPTVDYSPTKVPGSKVDHATYNGKKQILSDIPFNAGPPALQVKFTKAGTVTYYCDLHVGMKGIVRVLAKKKKIPTAKADAKTLKSQIARDFKVAKTRYNQTPPANTVYVGSAGKYGVEYFGYDPKVTQVPVGTTVTFQMTPGSFEDHTATTAGAENADPEKVDASYLGQIAQSFFNPAGFLPQGVWTSDNPANGPAVLTMTSHGNGFWNSGALDVQPDQLLPDRRSVTFGQAGTYEFYCMVHPQMHGTVIVG